jgi:hypothetical protein
MNRAIVLFAFPLAVLSLPAFAQAPQDDPNSYPPQQQAPAGPRLSAQELSNLVAPIALYPDMLLSQVLAASTYPAEIQQAQQWLAQNRGLRGRQLVDAAKQQPWDASVQALVAFPDVMNLLTRDIQWTTDLGNAFLAQQADVMDAIQRLRASARQNGRLADTPQQRVTYEDRNVVIQPTDPQVIYPPVYNPEYVWGPPVYGYYPVLGYPSVGFGFGYAVATFLGSFFSGLLGFGGWGWGCSWLGHGIVVNGLFFNHYGFHGYNGYSSRAAWVHDGGHRLGVPYGGGRFAGGRGGNGFASSGASYRGGNRQAQAYRGLTGGGTSGYRGGSSSYSGGSSRGYAGGGSYGGGYSSGSRGSSPSYSGGSARSYSGGGSYGGYSSGRGSAPSYAGGSARSYAGGGSYGGGNSSGSRGSGSPGRGWSAPSSHGSSAPHYSAPKSSGGSHSSGGGGHSSSKGGSHKR